MDMAMNTKTFCEVTPLCMWLRMSNNAATQRKHNTRIMTLCTRKGKAAPTLIMVALAYHRHLSLTSILRSAWKGDSANFDAGSCIDPPLRGASMTSGATLQHGNP
jgi:hypothetical protein